MICPGIIQAIWFIGTNQHYRVGQHSHESGPNGPATWAGPYGPSKYYGILWYVAVIYGMETDRFVSRISIIQVICHHRHFSQQSFAIMYAYSYMCSINLSVIHIYIYIYIYMIYVGDGLPTSIINQMIYVCCGPCGHARVLCNVTYRCGLCDHTPTRVGQMGQAIWTGQILWFISVCSCYIWYGDS